MQGTVALLYGFRFDCSTKQMALAVCQFTCLAGYAKIRNESKTNYFH